MPFAKVLESVLSAAWQDVDPVSCLGTSLDSLDHWTNRSIVLQSIKVSYISERLAKILETCNWVLADIDSSTSWLGMLLVHQMATETSSCWTCEGSYRDCAERSRVSGYLESIIPLLTRPFCAYCKAHLSNLQSVESCYESTSKTGWPWGMAAEVLYEQAWSGARKGWSMVA